MEHCHEISTPFWPGKKRKRKALSLNAGILFQLHISKGMAETTVHSVQYQITPYFQY